MFRDRVFKEDISLKEVIAGAAAKSLHLYPTLSDPLDCSLPGSSVHVVFQARVLEWVALPSQIWITGI